MIPLPPCKIRGTWTGNTFMEGKVDVCLQDGEALKHAQVLSRALS